MRVEGLIKQECETETETDLRQLVNVNDCGFVGTGAGQVIKCSSITCMRARLNFCVVLLMGFSYDRPLSSAAEYQKVDGSDTRTEQLWWNTCCAAGPVDGLVGMILRQGLSEQRGNLGVVKQTPPLPEG
jgi:hypothetical protein